MRRLLMVVACVLAGGRLAAAQALPDDVSSLPWIVDGGNVEAVARAGSRLYLGGDFRHVAPRSHVIGPFGAFGPQAGELVAAEPAITGQIRAVVDDGVGGWFVGGLINQGTAIAGLARLDATGRRVPWAIDIALNFSTIYAMARAGDVLYIAGDFTAVGGVARGFVAAIQISTQTLLPWNPNVTGSGVYTLHVSGSDVFLGGSFTTVGGLPRHGVARVDNATGAVLPFAPVLGGPYGPSVRAVATTPTRIYVGGIFTTADAASRANFAAFDRTSGALLALQPDPGVADTFALVEDIVVGGGRVVIAGTFSSLAGVARTNAGALDEATGLLTAWAPVIGGSMVRSVTVTASGVYLAGDIVTSLRARHAIKVDTSTGAIDAAWDPAVGGEVLALAWDGSRVALGGHFTTWGATRARNLAGIDLATNQVVPLPEPIGGVKALASDGARLYLSGSFQYVDTQPRSNLAAIDLASRQVTAFAPSVVLSAGFTQVGFLAVDGGRLFIGGGFDLVNGQARQNLAALDSTSGALTSFTAPAFAGLPSYGPSAMAVAGGRVWVAGAFTAVGATARAGLAALDAATGALDPVDLAPDGAVGALAFDGASYLYLTGQFSHLGGQPRGSIARVQVATAALDAWTTSAFGAGPVSAVPGLVTTYGAHISPASSLVGLFGVDDGGALVGWRPSGAGQPSLVHAALDGITVAGVAAAQGPKASPLFFARRSSGGAPHAVTDFGVTVQGTRVTVIWTPALTGAAPTSYRLIGASRPGAADLANIVIAPTPGFSLDLPPGQYFVRLVPQANGTDGPSTPEVGFVAGAVGCATLPAAPTLQVSGTLLQWTPAAGTPAAAYELRAGVAPGALSLVRLPLPASPAAFSAAAAPPGVYYVAVAAVNACGSGPVSNEVQVVVTPPSAPAAPSALAATVTGSTVSLSWTPPAGAVTGYVLEAGTAPGLANLVPGLALGATPSLVAPNVPAGTYRVRVRAANGALVSAPSNEITVVVP